MYGCSSRHKIITMVRSIVYAGKGVPTSEEFRTFGEIIYFFSMTTQKN